MFYFSALLNEEGRSLGPTLGLAARMWNGFSRGADPDLRVTSLLLETIAFPAIGFSSPCGFLGDSGRFPILRYGWTEHWGGSRE